MATYIYQCADCDNSFDVQATIQEKEEGKSEKFACPKCRSKNIRQEFSVIHFIKNIFKSDGNASGCCSDKKKCCGSKNDGNGCCGG